LTGSYAERAVRPAAELFQLPDNVSFAEGAAIGVPYATAYRGLFHRGRCQPGETVFIHGASGAVGTASIQLARAHGLTVIGSAGTEKGQALVREQGAHHVLDHGQDDYLDTLRELTGGNGPDLILEMLANVNLASDLTVVARYGRIVVIGNRGNIEINPRDAMTRDADVLGLALWNCSDAELASIHAGLGAGLQSGTLKPVIGREMPLAEAAQAHTSVLEPGAYGKIVLVP
jgi:NADPH2:quinone reductase